LRKITLLLGDRAKTRHDIFAEGELQMLALCPKARVECSAAGRRYQNLIRAGFGLLFSNSAPGLMRGFVASRGAKEQNRNFHPNKQTKRHKDEFFCCTVKL
jgi:hypothetical protein